MARGNAVEIPVNGSLSNASIERLACLLRHWTWADEAMARFEQELAGGWEYRRRSGRRSSVRRVLPLVCAVVRLQRSGTRARASVDVTARRDPSGPRG